MELKVGDRVRYKEFLGIIKYKGITLFPGLWYGVELDTPNGKNNGSVKGTSYFTCNDNHGIFVRKVELKKLEDSYKSESMYKLNDKENTNVYENEINKSASLNDIVENNFRNEGSVQRKLVLEENENKSDTENRFASDFTSTEVTKEIKNLQQKVDFLKSIKKMDRIKWKKEEQKLKATIDDLQYCIDDLEKNLADMKEQVHHLQEEKTSVEKEFKEQCNKSRDYEIENELETLTMDKEIAEEKYENLLTEYNEIKTTLDALKFENDYLKQLKGDTVVTPQDVEKYKSAIVTLNEQLSQLSREKFDKMKELEISIEHILDMENDCKKLSIELEKVNTENAELKNYVDNFAECENVIERLTDENQTYEAEIELMTAQINKLDEDNDKYLITLENRQEIISQLKVELAKLHDENGNLKENIVHKEMGYQNLDAALKEHQLVINELKQQNQDLLKVNEQLKLEQQCCQQIVPNNVCDKIETNWTEMKNTCNNLQIKLKDIEISCRKKREGLLSIFLPRNFGNIDAFLKVVDVDVDIEEIYKKVQLLIDEINRWKCSDYQKIVSLKFENKSFINRIIFLLEVLKVYVYKIIGDFKRCNADGIVNVSAEIYGTKSFITVLDNLIELALNDCFGENIDLSELEQGVIYFQKVLLDGFGYDCQTFETNDHLMGFLNSVYFGTVCINCDLDWLMELSADIETEKEKLVEWQQKVGDLVQQIQSVTKHCLTLSSSLNAISIGVECQKSMDDILVGLLNFVNGFAVGNNTLLEKSYISGLNTDLLIRQLSDKFTNTDYTIRSIKDLLLLLKNVYDSLNRISNKIENGYFDTEMNNAVYKDNPIILCSRRFQNELVQLKERTVKLENSQNQITNLKLNIHQLKEELSHESLRKDNLAQKLKVAQEINGKLTRKIECFTMKEQVACLPSPAKMVQTKRNKCTQVDHIPKNTPLTFHCERDSDSKKIKTYNSLVDEVRVLKNMLTRKQNETYQLKKIIYNRQDNFKRIPLNKITPVNNDVLMKRHTVYQILSDVKVINLKDDVNPFNKVTKAALERKRLSMTLSDNIHLLNQQRNATLQKLVNENADAHAEI